jgi:hypothetical protein
LFRARLKNNFENRKHKNIEKLLEFHISRKIDKYTVNIETTNFIWCDYLSLSLADEHVGDVTIPTQVIEYNQNLLQAD